MTNKLTTYRRRAGVALLAGAALTVAGCIWTAVAESTGHVSHHLFRFPLSQSAAVAFAVFAACTHLLILAGVVWLRRSGLAAGRWSATGLGCVIAGTALLFACELRVNPGQSTSTTARPAPRSSTRDSLWRRSWRCSG